LCRCITVEARDSFAFMQMHNEISISNPTTWTWTRSVWSDEVDGRVVVSDD